MKKTFVLWALSVVLCPRFLAAQEADAGLDLRATLSGQAVASNISTQDPRSGPVGTVGFRSVFYPTWKISDHWAVTGAWQLYSRPYFYGDLSTVGYGANGDLIQATLNYSRVSDKGSILFRAGQLTTAFGSFPLRYDDANNPLVDSPIEYGYYSVVSTLGLAGAQIDATRGKWDGRAQFVNSSPANPRSLFAHDQYGNWAGGAGYTIRQGFRIGVSGYRGPYLNRQSAYFFPGEVNPSLLPASGLGLEIEWAHRHWNVQGELQKFVLPYTVIPTFRQQPGYAEVKRVLQPRWYVAARSGYSREYAYGNEQSLEATVGFRPNRLQLIKADYELDHFSLGEYHFDKTFAVQIVTTLHFSAAAK